MSLSTSDHPLNAYNTVTDHSDRCSKFSFEVLQLKNVLPKNSLNQVKLWCFDDGKTLQFAVLLKDLGMFHILPHYCNFIVSVESRNVESRHRYTWKSVIFFTDTYPAVIKWNAVIVPISEWNFAIDYSEFEKSFSSLEWLSFNCTVGPGVKHWRPTEDPDALVFAKL